MDAKVKTEITVSHAEHGYLIGSLPECGYDTDVGQMRLWGARKMAATFDWMDREGSPPPAGALLDRLDAVQVSCVGSRY